MAFIGLALLARYRKLPIPTGIFLALAILIKIYPIVLLPALFRRGEYKMPAIVAAITAFAYACYSSVGIRVFGFLGGYVQEEGIQSGDRYFLLELWRRVPGFHTLPVSIYLAGCCIIFLALIVWCWKTCCNPSHATAELTQPLYFGLPAGAGFLPQVFALSLSLMLLFSPHYPWYIAWLIPFFTLMPNLTVFTYICSMFYLCTTALAVGSGPSQFLLNKILYGSVLLAFCIEMLLRRWPIHRTFFKRDHFLSSDVATCADQSGK
jgi:hypothetical protein